MGAAVVAEEAGAEANQKRKEIRERLERGEQINLNPEGLLVEETS